MGNYAGIVVRGRDGENDNAGADVAILGDINGDGIADFAVAARNADGSFNAPYSEGQYSAFEAGAVYVIFGDDATETSEGLPATLNVADLDGTNGFVITPDSDLFKLNRELPDFGDFANSIVALGDINGDMVDDFGITNRATFSDYSAYYGFFNYTSPYDGEGVAYVILGGQTFEATQEVDDLAGFRIDVEGEVVGMVGLGDINGDGIGDVAVNTVDRDANGTREIETFYFFDADGNGVYDSAAASNAGYYGEYAYYGSLKQAVGQATSFVIFGTDEERVSDDPIAGGGNPPIGVANATGGEGIAAAAMTVPEDAPTAGETIVNATQLDGSDGFSVQTGTSLTDVSSYSFEGRNGGIYAGSSSIRGGVSSIRDVNGDGVNDLVASPVDGVNELFDNYGYYGSGDGERLLTVIGDPDGNRTVTLTITGTNGPGSYYTQTYQDPDYSTFNSSSGSFVIFGNASDAPFPADIDPTAFPRPAEIEFRTAAAFEEQDIAGVGNAVGNDLFDDVVTRGFLFDGEASNTSGVFIEGAMLLPGSANGLPDAAGADGSFFNEDQLLIDGDAALFVDFTAGNIGAGFDRLGFSYQGAVALGDVGGDLSDDFAIIAARQELNAEGAPSNPFEGAVYLTFGSVDPLSGIIDLGASFVEGIAAADRPAYRIEGFENSFGLSVSGLGDVNGDGVNDLIIGDQFADGGSSSDGEVYVVFGGTDALSAADFADGVEDGIIDVDNLGVDVETGALPIELSLRGNSTLFRREGDIGSTLFEFIVDRSGDENQPVSFDFAVTPSGPDGADPDDFVGGALPGGTIDFADGADFATVTVEVQGDFTQENSEDFTLTISNPTTVGISPVSINRDTATARILNDDFPVNLRINNASVVEGESDTDTRVLTFTVTRSGELDVEATVDYAVEFSSATADDLETGTPTTGTVTFAVGQTSATIELPINEDTEVESNEFLTVQLSNPTATTPELAPVGTVVPVVISDSSGFGTILTDNFPVELRINNAFVAEGNVGDTRELVFTITRSGDFDTDVDVDLTLSPASFRPAGADDFEVNPFGTQVVSFADGDISQEIRLAIAEDVNIEDSERIEARLDNVRSPTGDEVVSTILDGFAVGTISNDDFPPLITVNGGGFQNEGTFGTFTPFTFTIDRTGNTDGFTTVSFDLNAIPFQGDFFAADSADIAGIVIDGQPITGSGFLPGFGYEVVFGDGESSKEIVVNVNHDGIIEPRETFELRITEVDTTNGVNYQIFAPARTATILNDDGRPPIIPPGVEADVFGDPHIVTLDGLGYDFQAVGEYILVETLPGAANPFQVQVRFEPLPGSDLVSTTTRMAVNIGTDHVVEVDALGDEPFLIIGPDGTPRVPTDAEIALGQADVDGDGISDLFFDLDTGEFTVVLNDQNEQLKGKVMDGTMNVCVFLADTPTGNQGNVRGLMGDADGDDAAGDRDTTDDLALRAGTEVPVGAGLVDINGNPVPEGVPLAQDIPLMLPVEFDTLYGIFADGWRLDGTNGKDRAFSDLLPAFPDTFPAALLTVDDLPEQVRLEAEAAVLAAQDPDDPLDPSVFEAAVLDFALTGNPNFITGALGLAAEEEESTEPTGSPDIPVTVSVSVQPNEFTEGDAGTTPVEFTFFRLDDGAAPLSIAYNITGTADADDVAAGTNFSGTVDFAGESSEGAGDGETEATVVIDVLGDLATELDETLTVTITDSGGALIAGATATAVIATDDFAPEAQDDAFSTDELTRVEGDLFGDNQVEDAADNSDSDADGDDLTITELNGSPINQFAPVTLPSGARLRLREDGTFFYDPFGVVDGSDPTDGFAFLGAGDVATDTFTYTVIDGNGGEDTATVQVTIQGIDNAPVARLDSDTQSEDVPTSDGNLTDNDVDPEGEQLAVTSIELGSEVAAVTSEEDGVLTLDNGATLTVGSDGSYEFALNGAFQELHDRDNGLGSSQLLIINYTLEDPAGNDDTGQFFLTIDGANDAPEFDASYAFDVAENQTVVGSVSAADVDTGDTVTYGLSGVDAGLFDIDADTGAITFDNAPDFENPLDDNGDNAYEVTIEADDGIDATTQDVTITVTDVDENTAPEAQDGQITLDEDNENTGQLLFSDAETPVGDLQVLIGTDVQNGTLELGDNGAFTYRPNDNFFGTDTFTYQVSDGELLSDLATIDITVNPVNDAPVVAPLQLNTDEDTATSANVFVDGDVSDVDNPIGDLFIAGATANGVALTIGVVNELAAGGTLLLQEDGGLLFNPDGDFEALGFNPQPEPPAEIEVELEVSDGQDSTFETITLGIFGVNDAPVAEDATFEVSENTTAVGQVAASDVDSPTLTYSITDGADADLFEVDENTGDVSFRNPPDFEANGSAAGNNTYEVIVSASDGNLSDTATLTVNVTDVDEDTGPNVVEGTTGRDFLKGTDGDDQIFAFAGSDHILGGTGADEFVFGDELSNGMRERDFIRDFEVGVDSLTLETNDYMVVARGFYAIVQAGADNDLIYVLGNITSESDLDITNDVLLV